MRWRKAQCQISLRLAPDIRAPRWTNPLVIRHVGEAYFLQSLGCERAADADAAVRNDGRLLVDGMVQYLHIQLAPDDAQVLRRVNLRHPSLIGRAHIQ